MSTKAATKTKRDAAAESKFERLEKLRIWLIDNDALNFARQRSAEDVASVLKTEGVGQYAITEILKEKSVCFFWQTAKLKRESEHEAWTAAEWIALEHAAEQFAHHLEKLTRAEATVLLRSRCVTNEKQVAGLVKRFHVWKGGNGNRK